VLPAAELVARFRREYHDARMRLGTGCTLLNSAWETMTECA
jgi:nitronate monooxygenase